MRIRAFFISLNFIVLGCLCSCQNQPQSELYMKDKEHIEKAFVSNVEASRRILLFHKNGFTYADEYQGLPDTITVYSGDIFACIAHYWDSKKKKNYAVPVPACEFLDVEVGSISYSVDSLKCVALVTFNDKSAFYTENDNRNSYHGCAIIGIRENKDQQFKIYLEDLISFDGFPSRRQTLMLLKLAYYHLKGDITPQSGGAQYTCGINNPEFFETAHEFSRIDSLDLYWCETYMIPGGDRRPFVFYSNQDSTITKYLCGDPEPEKQAD